MGSCQFHAPNQRLKLCLISYFTIQDVSVFLPVKRRKSEHTRLPSNFIYFLYILIYCTIQLTSLLKCYICITNTSLPSGSKPCTLERSSYCYWDIHLTLSHSNNFIFNCTIIVIECHSTPPHHQQNVFAEDVLCPSASFSVLTKLHTCVMPLSQNLLFQVRENDAYRPATEAGIAFLVLTTERCESATTHCFELSLVRVQMADTAVFLSINFLSLVFCNLCSEENFFYFSLTVNFLPHNPTYFYTANS